MSGNSRPSCYICGSTNLVIDRDYDHGTVSESEEKCNACGFYHYEFLYGHSRETILFVTIEKTDFKDDQLMTSKEEKRLKDSKHRKDAIEEAKAILKDERCLGFINAFKHNPSDLAVKGALADYLADSGLYPLMEEGLRNIEHEESTNVEEG